MAGESPPLVLPEPLDNQRPILDAAKARKVVRAGRRFSKTRLAFLAAVSGHGPGWYDGTPQYPGILQGRDVVWVSSDYPNLSTVVWNELIVPRFGNLPYATLNKNEHTVSISGLGTLFLRPETAIDGVRGVGSRLGGVIADEAAHWDLGGALRRVILPALLDNRGWLLTMSTTNRGWDGNEDRVTPSYFNRLCAEIRLGERSSEWQEWTGTAYDNPVLEKEAIDELVAEYDPDSAEFKQEVLAELLTGGAGLALPHLDAKTHLVPPFPIPDQWLTFGSFDWGYNHPFSFGAWAADPDGNLFRTQSVQGRHQTPIEIAQTVAQSVDVKTLRYIVGGKDCWNKDHAKGIAVPSIADTLQAEPNNWKMVIVADLAGKGPRHQRLDNFRRYCGWPETATRPVQPPRLFVFDTPANRIAFNCWSGMLLDPNDEETPLKVDADHKGRGGDDPYDEASYGLSSRPLTVLKPVVRFENDRSPGVSPKTGKPVPRPTVEQEMSKLFGTRDAPLSRKSHRRPRW